MVKRALFAAALILLLNWPGPAICGEAWESWDWMGKSTSEKQVIVKSELDDLNARSKLLIEPPADTTRIADFGLPDDLTIWCPDKQLRMRSTMAKGEWPKSRKGYTIEWWQNYMPTAAFPEKWFDPPTVLKRLESAKGKVRGYKFLQAIQVESGGAGLIEWKTAEYNNALYWIRWLRSTPAEPAGMNYIEFRFYAVKR
jgi:hypothetical protein